MDHLNQKIESAGLLEESAVSEVIKQGSIEPWIQKVAVMAISIVMEAFDNSGDGKWSSWKNANYHNEGGQLLVDSGQLRDSITYEVS